MLQQPDAIKPRTIKTMSSILKLIKKLKLDFPKEILLDANNYKGDKEELGCALANLDEMYGLNKQLH